MAYLSLQEINSNPIYQPPKDWISTIEKQQEIDKQYCISKLKWLKINKTDDGCNNLMEMFPHSCFFDNQNKPLLKKDQPTIKYVKGDIIIETESMIDYESCEDICDCIKTHLKNCYNQLIIRTKLKRIRQAPFLPRRTDIVIKSCLYFRYKTSNQEIEYFGE